LIVLGGCRHAGKIYHAGGEFGRPELLCAARRKAAEGIVFDLGDGRAAAAFRTTSNRSWDTGVGIAWRSWVFSHKAFQNIENPLHPRRFLSSVRHKKLLFEE
jgi:hypothetical protein